MSSPTPPPRAPGQGYGPPNFNSNPQRPPDLLADNMQNLQIHRPPGQPPTMVPGPRPPPFSRPSIQSPTPFVSPPGSLPGASPTPFVPPPGSLPGASPTPFVPPYGSLPGASQPRPTHTSAGFPRASPPARPPPPNFQGDSQPPLVPGRPTGQAFPQPPPSSSASRPFPGTFPSASPVTGFAMRPPPNVPTPVSSNGPNVFNQGPVNVALQFPPPGSSQGPPVGPHLGGIPSRGPPIMGSSPRALQAQGVSPFLGSPTPGVSVGTPSQMPIPFSTGGQGLQPPSVPAFASQPPWQVTRPGIPMGPGSMQPPTMYGIPPSSANQQAPHISPGMSLPSTTGAPGSGPSRIDPNQIPRPVPSSAITVFETRQNNQACIPPPATSDFVVKDTGNCSPRFMRCTIGQIPCTSDLATTASMPLALLVQPLALPHPSEEPIQVVDFGESGPLRCSRCKGYINPFMKFVDHGKHFICNLCGFTNDTPREYYCNLGPDGKRRDAHERPELCRGTVEFVATKEYMVRDPMPATFFFTIDVSMNAVQTGATAAACSAISQVISDLPEGPRTMVGIATFDSTIHFYSLKRALQQPQMLIVPDVQDVYTPLQSDVVVPLAECRERLEQLLESIPTMFQNNRVVESAFGAAIKAAYLAMNSTGGRLLVFQSVIPSFGIGTLSAREAEGRVNTSSSEKEVHKLLQPLDKTLKTMAIELAEYQVCVDVFITSQSYVDIASVSVVPRTTGGQVYYYYPFSALTDSAKLYNDLRWNITRPQGFEAVMRVRCSQGLQVQDYSGNFCKRIPTDVDLPAIDCDKTILVTFKHDDKFQDNSECSFQCALLYTTVYGQRRIRVHTLSLMCTTTMSNLFRAADLDAQFACFLKQAANEIPNTPLIQVKEQMTNLCINILYAYRKYCATVSSSGQLILPEALKLLPLYTLALIKSTGLRTDGRVDDRSYWASRAALLSTSLAIPLVFPRMIAVHNLLSQEEDTPAIPYSVSLSSERVTDDGIYLLENGEDCLIYVGNMVNTEILLQLFGVPSVDGIAAQFVLKQFDNDLSKKLNNVVNEIRRERCSYLRMRLCKRGDPSGMLFFSYLVEDKAPGNLSYVEFLVHIHRQIQTKMA